MALDGSGRRRGPMHRNERGEGRLNHGVADPIADRGARLPVAYVAAIGEAQPAVWRPGLRGRTSRAITWSGKTAWSSKRPPSAATYSSSVDR